MAEYTLDDLNAITEPAATDLAHVRNTAGFDKKITWDNLRAAVISYQEKTGNFTTVESAVTANKVQAFRNTSSSHITMTLGTSGKAIGMRPDSGVMVVYNGTTWYEVLTSNDTTFTVTAAGWFTVFRTKKNFNGIIKLSGYADNLKDYITFSVYGHEDAGDHDVTVLEQSRKGSIAGITKARWGDAGAGNGICLQLYVDPDTDTSVIINAEMFGAKQADSIVNAEGFVFGPHTSVAQDADGNAVTVFRTYYRAALPELIRSNPYRMACHPDIIVDGSVVTRVEPGVYNSIIFMGDGNMGCGKYIVLGDFTIPGGVTVSVDQAFGAITTGVPDLFISTRNWQGNAGLASNISSTMYALPQCGGGRGGTINASGATSGAGPCGCGCGAPTSKSRGGGWIIVNVLGKVIISGALYADGEVTSVYNSAGGGGLLVFRSLEESLVFGDLRARGGNSPGADAGGGVIELYDWGTITVTTDVSKGGTGGGPEDGSVFKIDLTSQPESVVAGGSDVVTNDEYLHAGKAIREEGGWWF